MEKRGIRVPRHLEDYSYRQLKDKYESIQRERSADQGVQQSRNILLMFVSGIEFLNNRYDPFNLQLDGWSESVHENIDDFDEVFEELYDKYKNAADVSPEVKFLFMLGSSAFMFHLTKTLFRSALPNINNILKQNPEITSAFGNAVKKTFQEGIPHRGGMQSQFQNSTQQNNMEMQGPTNIDDILNNIDNNVSTMKPENTQRVIDVSDSEDGETATVKSVEVKSKPKRKPGRPRKKKNDAKSEASVITVDI